MEILKLSKEEGGKCGVQHCDKISPFAAIHTFVIPRGIPVVARWNVNSVQKFDTILLGIYSKLVFSSYSSLLPDLQQHGPPPQVAFVISLVR